MLMLVVAGAGFAAIHLAISGTPARDALVARLGEMAYRGLFSLASGALLGLMIWGYARVRSHAVTPFYGQRWLADVLMLVSFTLIVLGITTPGVTGVGGEKQLREPDPARGIHRVTRHPFLWGMALWALVHMVYNPGAADALFFGTFLLVALAGTFSIDAKRARKHGQAWAHYAQLTSNLPFVAIAQGRNRFAAGEMGWRWFAAIAVFALVFAFHGRLFGMPAG